MCGHYPQDKIAQARTIVKFVLHYSRILVGVLPEHLSAIDRPPMTRRNKVHFCSAIIALWRFGSATEDTNVKIDREKLAARLKSETVVAIAESMEITPLQLAVICKEHRLEWPGLGKTRVAGSQTQAAAPTSLLKETPEIPLPDAEARRLRKISVSRKQLYELVWAYPVVQLSKVWGISDVGLAKACKRHEIPRPGLGHWARFQNGYTCRRVRLPRPNEDYDIPISCSSADEAEAKQADVEEPVNRLEYYRRNYALLDDEQANAASHLYERELSTPEIVVPPADDEFHPLVLKTLKNIRRSKKDDRKLVRPDGKGLLAVHVAPETVDRAMRLYNAIIIAAESRGWQVRVDVTEKIVREQYRSYDGVHPAVTHVESRTFVHLLGERVEIELTEKSAQQMRQLTDEEAKSRRRIYLGDPPKEYWFTPTGALTLRVLSSRLPRLTWTDGKTRTVEGVLNNFMRSLIDAAVDLRAYKLESEVAAVRRAEEAERQAEQDKLWRQEQARIKQLEADMQQWSAAQRIREFVATVQSRAMNQQHSTERGTDLGDWLFWATKVAERQDPLTAGLPAYTTYGQRGVW